MITETTQMVAASAAKLDAAKSEALKTLKVGCVIWLAGSKNLLMREIDNICGTGRLEDQTKKAAREAGREFYEDVVRHSKVLARAHNCPIATARRAAARTSEHGMRSAHYLAQMLERSRQGRCRPRVLA